MKKNIAKLYWEALDKNQRKTFIELKKFGKYGILGGGTALALQFGHRKSFDFDIFVFKPLSKKFLYKIKQHFKKIELLVDTSDEITFISPQNIKITFLFYPFKNLYKPVYTDSISLFQWKDIILDKAHALGRRGEWRDYVDIYFGIQKGFTLTQIIKNARKKFGDLFSERLFLNQLCYFGDITDFTVEYLTKEKPTKKEIQKFFEEQIKNLKI